MDKLAGPLAGTSPEQEQEIDLRQYWRIVSRYKWGILGLAIAITVLATLIVFSMDPVYRSTVTLLIEQKQAKVITIEEVYGLDGSNKEYLQTQFEILKSRELAARVVRELKLETHPEFAPQEETKQETDQTSFKLDWRFLLPKGHQKNPSISDDEKFNRIVDRFSANLTVAPVRNTQLVKISFESFDKALAARVANAMAYAYISSQIGRAHV